MSDVFRVGSGRYRAACKTQSKQLRHVAEIWTCHWLGQATGTKLVALLLSVLFSAATEQAARWLVQAELSAQTLVDGFRGVLRACLDGDMILDSSFVVEETTAGIERLLHASKDELVGVSFLDFLDQHDAEAFQKFVQRPSCFNCPSRKPHHVPPCLRVSIRSPSSTVVLVDIFHLRLPALVGSHERHLLAIREDLEAVSVPEAEMSAPAIDQTVMQRPGCVESMPQDQRSDSKSSMTSMSRTSTSKAPGGVVENWPDLVEVKYLLDAGTELFDILEVRLRFSRQDEDSRTMPQLQKSLHPSDWRKIAPRLVASVWSSFDPCRNPDSTDLLGAVQLKLPHGSSFLEACTSQLGVVCAPVIEPASGDNKPRPILLGLRFTDFLQSPLESSHSRSMPSHRGSSFKRSGSGSKGSCSSIPEGAQS